MTVYAYDAASGQVRWHFEAPAVFLAPPAFAPGPAITGGGVYLADYLGTVYALDAVDGLLRMMAGEGDVPPVHAVAVPS